MSKLFRVYMRNSFYFGVSEWGGTYKKKMMIQTMYFFHRSLPSNHPVKDLYTS